MKKSSRKRYYTITETAKKLGVTRAAVHRAIRQGRLEWKWGKIDIVRTVKTEMKVKLISAKDLERYRVSAIHKWVGEKTP